MCCVCFVLPQQRRPIWSWHVLLLRSSESLTTAAAVAAAINIRTWNCCIANTTKYSNQNRSNFHLNESLELIENDSRVFVSCRHIVIIARHRFNHSQYSSRTCVWFDLTFFQSNPNQRHYNQMNFGLKSGDGESAMHKRIYGTHYHYVNDRIINN